MQRLHYIFISKASRTSVASLLSILTPRSGRDGEPDFRRLQFHGLWGLIFWRGRCVGPLLFPRQAPSVSTAFSRIRADGSPPAGHLTKKRNHRVKRDWTNKDRSWQC